MSECRNCIECTAGNDCPVARRTEQEREEQRKRTSIRKEHENE
jgi:hypothetical protein